MQKVSTPLSLSLDRVLSGQSLFNTCSNGQTHARVRGSPTLTTFFFVRMIQVPIKRAIIGPPALRADDGPTVIAGLVAAIFQGIRTCIARKPYIFVIFQGSPDPLPPPPPLWIHTWDWSTESAPCEWWLRYLWSNIYLPCAVFGLVVQLCARTAKALWSLCCAKTGHRFRTLTGTLFKWILTQSVFTNDYWSASAEVCPPVCGDHPRALTSELSLVDNFIPPTSV